MSLAGILPPLVVSRRRSGDAAGGRCLPTSLVRLVGDTTTRSLGAAGGTTPSSTGPRRRSWARSSWSSSCCARA
eukprot:12650750-Heterocapsa_arctica.AAC.1